MVAVPSVYTVELPSNPATPTNLYLAWGTKFPADTITLTIDATRRLATLGRLVVGTPQVTCTPLTITNIEQIQNLTSFQVGGGSDGSAYGITWFATLDDGSTQTFVIWLPVASQSVNIAGLTVIAKGDQGDPGPPGAAGAFSITLSRLATLSGSSAIAAFDTAEFFAWFYNAALSASATIVLPVAGMVAGQRISIFTLGGVTALNLQNANWSGGGLPANSGLILMFDAVTGMWGQVTPPSMSFSNLPTVDPGVLGQPWIDGGVVAVSGY